MEAAESEMPTAASLPAKLELSPVAEASSAAPLPAPASEGSASLGEQEEEGSHSYSPASSSCSATYSNLGKSDTKAALRSHTLTVSMSWRYFQWVENP